MFKSELDYKKTYENIVNEMVGYFTENKLKSAVLGISGGIDSTLVAALMDDVAERIGNGFKFYGVSMPTSTTDPDELAIARKVGNEFCHEFSVKDADELTSKMIDEMGLSPKEDDDFDTKLRRGNVKSRARMIYLYDYAKKKNGLVLGTDNYSEYLLGFSTIGGDGLFDYCPIQYLWKTEVYGLSKYIVKRYIENGEWSKADAVKESIDLTPMDGLGISKSDMEQIGAKNYYEVDNILQCYLLGEDCPEVDKSVFDKVVKRHLNSEFKRNHPVRISRESIEK